MRASASAQAPELALASVWAPAAEVSVWVTVLAELVPVVELGPAAAVWAE